MAVIKGSEIVSVEIPKDFYGSLVVRCVDVEFTQSKVKPDGSGGNPMIVSEWEVVGVKNKEGGVDDSIVQGNKKYIIAGLGVRKVYHTLSPKAIARHQEFWSKANNKPLDQYEVDTENPDTSYYKGLVMSAVCKATEFNKTRKTTEEERAAMEAEGKPVQASVEVVDDEGKPLVIKGLEIDTFNRRFSGDLPTF